MDKLLLSSILKKYEQKRLYAEKSADKRKADLYSAYPRLQQIDDELSSAGISTARALIAANSSELVAELSNKISALKKEKTDFLKSLGLSEDYLAPQYSCSLCNDTGYITSRIFFFYV